MGTRTKTKARKPTKKRKPPAKALQASTAAVKRAPAPLLRAEPGPTGRRLLDIVETYNRLWENPPDEDKHPRAYERHEIRSWRLNEQADAVVRRIARQRVRGLSDIVDKALALGWELNTITPRSFDSYDLIDGIIGVAGLSWGQHLDNERYATAA